MIFILVNEVECEQKYKKYFYLRSVEILLKNYNLFNNSRYRERRQVKL